MRPAWGADQGPRRTRRGLTTGGGEAGPGMADAINDVNASSAISAGVDCIAGTAGREGGGSGGTGCWCWRRTRRWGRSSRWAGRQCSGETRTCPGLWSGVGWSSWMRGCWSQNSLSSLWGRLRGCRGMYLGMMCGVWWRRRRLFGGDESGVVPTDLRYGERS